MNARDLVTMVSKGWWAMEYDCVTSINKSVSPTCTITIGFVSESYLSIYLSVKCIRAYSCHWSGSRQLLLLIDIYLEPATRMSPFTCRKLQTGVKTAQTLTLLQHLRLRTLRISPNALLNFTNANLHTQLSSFSQVAYLSVSWAFCCVGLLDKRSKYVLITVSMCLGSLWNSMCLCCLWKSMCHTINIMLRLPRDRTGGKGGWVLCISYSSTHLPTPHSLAPLWLVLRGVLGERDVTKVGNCALTIPGNPASPPPGVGGCGVEGAVKCGGGGGGKEWPV